MVKNFFDIINSISTTKKDLSNEPGFEKVYNSFMIMRYLSLDPELIDIVLYVSQLKLDKFREYKVLMGLIEKKKRWFKYPKKEVKDSDQIKLVQEYYSINEERAKDILPLLDKKDLKDLKQAFGGKK